MMTEMSSGQSSEDQKFKAFSLENPEIPTIDDILTREKQSTTDRVGKLLVIDILKWAGLHPEVSEPLHIGLNAGEFRRTAQLSQLGFHPDPTELNRIMDNAEKSPRTKDNHFDVLGLNRSEVQPYRHTRFTHSLFAARNAIIIGEKLGLSPEETVILTLGVLYHDVGHAPLSHVGDDVCISYGMENHAARSIRIASNVFSEYPFVDRIASIISEEPGLGKILNILDTWSYLKIDMLEAGIDREIPDIPSLFGEHILIDESTGLLKVDEEGMNALQTLLSVRSDAYGLLYTHPNSLIVEAMHKKAIKALIDNGVITLDQFAESIDQNIYDLLLYDSMGSRIAGDLFGGFLVGPTLLSSGVYYPVGILEWDDLGRKSADEIDSFIQHKLRALGMDIDQNDIVVATPQQPNGKTITVVKKDGENVALLKAEGSILARLQGKVLICFNRDIQTEATKYMQDVMTGLKPPKSN